MGVGARIYFAALAAGYLAVAVVCVTTIWDGESIHKLSQRWPLAGAMAVAILALAGLLYCLAVAGTGEVE